jgi:hypothetical protein
MGRDGRIDRKIKKIVSQGKQTQRDKEVQRHRASLSLLYSISDLQPLLICIIISSSVCNFLQAQYMQPALKFTQVEPHMGLHSEIFLINFRLEMNWLTLANTLAYFSMESTEVVKGFFAPSPNLSHKTFKDQLLKNQFLFSKTDINKKDLKPFHSLR